MNRRHLFQNLSRQFVLFCLVTATSFLTVQCKKKDTHAAGLLSEPMSENKAEGTPPPSQSRETEVLPDQSPTGISAAALSAGQQTSTNSPLGQWQIRCLSMEEKSELTRTIYTFQVTGAKSEDDESQNIFIEITKESASSSIKNPTEATVGTSTTAPKDFVSLGNKSLIVGRTEARGAVSPEKSIFVGFSGGAITTRFNLETKVHEGLLTLISDPDASGIRVRCDTRKQVF